MAKVKNKKSSLADNYAQRRKQQQMTKKTLTPFEIHVNKDKQKVLGRKSKADVGLPGVARAKAITKRKNTLLLEYKVKDKDNIFYDRRIGEKNSGMSEEDKAMARFAAEKIKSHNKKRIYNLNDEEVLTHRGQSLMDVEKYDDPRSDEDDYSDSENKTGKLDKKFVGDVHFGGGILSKPDSEVSRKDLIDQLITESKKRKAERQKIREQTIDLTEKLDSEWRDLLPLVAASKKTSDQVEEKPKADDYDIAIRELKFEARAMPSDKLKSEEEVAKQEKLELEKLEEERLARMQGFNDEKEFQSRHRSADDLDDFHIEKIEEESDSEENIQNGILKHSNKKEDDKNQEVDSDEDESNSSEQEKDEKEEDEGSNVESDKDEEQSEDDLSDLKDSDSSEDEEPENQNLSESENKIISTKNAQVVEKINNKQTEIAQETEMKKDESKCTVSSFENSEDIVHRKERETIIQKAQKELPYTFAAPKTYEELLSLFKDKDPVYQSVIVERIIKCNHWKLSVKNKEKLANLFSFLLQYLDDCSSVSNEEELVNFFQIFDRLCPHLYDLTHANPEVTKKCLHDILKEKHEQFENNIKVYPGLDTLILLKLVSIIYPTSDFRHPIVTPCLVFMSQILLRCKVKTKEDLSKGLFVCTLLLEYTLMSKRWSPSVINFLRGVLYISFPKPFSKVIKALPPFKTVGDFSNMLVLKENHKNSEIDPATIRMKAKDFLGEEMSDNYKIRTFVIAIHLLCEFQEMYSELDAAFLIFEPILTLLQFGSVKRYPLKVKENVHTLINNLKKLQEKKLEHLMLERKKPKALRLYEPRIEVVHDGKRHKPMSKEKAEREKLIHKLKKETKSAIREIRKDTAFLSKVKIKQQISSDQERKRKVKEIFGDAAAQQSELKKWKKT